jgi:predicted O-methyltransferase YrrM
LTSKLFQIKSYFRYWLNAVDEHSLHSPFFFELYATHIKGKPAVLSIAESLRKKLLNDDRIISIVDLGSRSGTYQKEISSIAATSLSPPWVSSLYQKIISIYDHKNIIELGTSLGINTVYLAQKKDAVVTTFEGADEVGDLAELTLEFANALNVELIRGNIDDTLGTAIQRLRKIDFVLMDANHTYEATVRYFHQLLPRLHEKSVVVIDDIHSSAGMEQAWKEIKGNKLIYGSADLYRCGILFFDPSLNKQHVILQM